MSSLEITGLRKSYGAVDVLKGIDLSIEKGEFIVFVGPSGCGKSTLLRSIAGLEDITSGSIVLDGEVIDDVPAAQRGLAMVFQSYALYPHMTVYNNMAFGLKIAAMAKADIDKRVRAAGDILQLSHLLDRLPKDLSGGQRQRVAIGRAICRNPKVFLFDEPLSNLDASLRVATRLEIAKLKKSLPGTTMIYVTHDQVEAMTLADRIVVLSAGAIEQVGTPMELYDYPANRFVAQFIGSPSMNLVECQTDTENGQPVLRLPGGRSLPYPALAKVLPSGSTLSLGVRPEHLVLADSAGALISGKVVVQEALGELTQLYVECDGMADPVIVKVPGAVARLDGQTVHLGAAPSHLYGFDAAGHSLGFKPRPA
jgi:alpha-glucoside transport system ATP-binding protein